MSDLFAVRTAIVQEHMDAENRKDVASAVNAFAEPRYEVVTTGEVFDGGSAVSGFLTETMEAFPDFTFHTHKLHDAPDAIIAEVTFAGTHLGSWRGLPATGKPVSYRMCNIFEFDGDALVCERLYFDILTVLQQVGIADDPTSLRGKITALATHPGVALTAAAHLLRERKER
jgi:steroid delta-isomerase-like uncharacterized protein